MLANTPTRLQSGNSFGFLKVSAHLLAKLYKAGEELSSNKDKRSKSYTQRGAAEGGRPIYLSQADKQVNL
ncbi:hypothetical protein AGMMS50276_16800 [Synergistales bacterium]|nr:hypothetical protein AGMMS50276_16800 [Synergistales bacterium]